MKRTMYVLQNEDGRFYCKSDSVSSMHGLNKDFENAYLFKTRQGAELRKKLPCYSKCVIREVELKLVKNESKWDILKSRVECLMDYSENEGNEDALVAYQQVYKHIEDLELEEE